MSPLAIHALLEFQTLAYPNTDGGYAMNLEAIRQLRRDGMISAVPGSTHQLHTKWELTERGRDLFKVIVSAAGSGLTTAESIWTELAKKAILEVTDGNIGTGPDMDVVPFVIGCFVSQADRIKEMRVLMATSTLTMTEAEKEIGGLREELEKYQALAVDRLEQIEVITELMRKQGNRQTLRAAEVTIDPSETDRQAVKSLITENGKQAVKLAKYEENFEKADKFIEKLRRDLSRQKNLHKSQATIIRNQRASMTAAESHLRFNNKVGAR